MLATSISVLIGLLGIVVMMLGVILAVAFLDARVFFDMPFAQGDTIKIGMVTLAAMV